jgi:hypothetical protein
MCFTRCPCGSPRTERGHAFRRVIHPEDRCAVHRRSEIGGNRFEQEPDAPFGFVMLAKSSTPPQTKMRIAHIKPVSSSSLSFRNSANISAGATKTASLLDNRAKRTMCCTDLSVLPPTLRTQSAMAIGGGEESHGERRRRDRSAGRASRVDHSIHWAIRSDDPQTCRLWPDRPMPCQPLEVASYEIRLRSSSPIHRTAVGEIAQSSFAVASRCKLF